MASRTVFCWATMLVLVGAATSSPLDKKEPKATGYYGAYPGYEEHSGYDAHHEYHEDHNAVLAAKNLPTIAFSEVFRVQAQIILGKVFMAIFGMYVVFVLAAPYSLAEVRSLQQNTPVTRLLDDKDFLLNAVLSIIGVPADKACRQRVVCESVAEATTLPFFSSHVGNLARSAIGPFEFETALEEGASGGNCSSFSCTRTTNEFMNSWIASSMTALTKSMNLLTGFMNITTEFINI